MKFLAIISGDLDNKSRPKFLRKKKISQNWTTGAWQKKFTKIFPKKKNFAHAKTP